MLSTKNRADWAQPEYWSDKVPSFLTISSDGTKEGSPSQGIDGNNPIKYMASNQSSAEASPEGRHRRLSLQEKGYALVDDSFVENDEMIRNVRQGIDHLHCEMKLPACFILLFDATWELAQKSWKQVLKPSTLETNQFHFDILAWYIDSEGFSPHRDRQPDSDPKEGFGGDEARDAKFVTHWIALTDATPENSCLYMIPKDQDPGYFIGDLEGMDPLRVALPNKQDYQHIRAMPRQAGQSILFTHRTIHWGSVRDSSTNQPFRIAISFVCCDSSFEEPYVDPRYFNENTLPPFRIRLLLVCAQLLIYYQRFNLSKDFIKCCYEYCKEHENELGKAYRQKVFVEFVKAIQEQTEVGDAGSGLMQHINLDVDDQGQEEEDYDEAVMEEMLLAAQKGYGDFHDDYDDQFGEHDDQAGTGDDDSNADDAENDHADDGDTKKRIDAGKRGNLPSKDNSDLAPKRQRGY